MEEWKNYARRLRAISAYRGLLALPALRALQGLVEELAREQPDGGKVIDCYADTFYQLQRAGYDSLGAYLWAHLRYDDTPYGDAAARGTSNDALAAAARQDIGTFGALAALDGAAWRNAAAAAAGADTAGLLPAWRRLPGARRGRICQISGLSVVGSCAASGAGSGSGGV